MPIERVILLCTSVSAFRQGCSTNLSFSVYLRVYIPRNVFRIGRTVDPENGKRKKIDLSNC